MWGTNPQKSAFGRLGVGNLLPWWLVRGMTKNNHFQQEADQPWLFTPSTILTNIPGILGYYPSDSLLFVCMYNSADSDYHADTLTGTMTVGPVFRLDLAEMHHISDVADAMEAVQPDVVLMFVITDNLSAMGEALPDYLMHAVSCGMMPVLGCWHAESITTGTAYELLFGSDDMAPELFENPSPFRNGTIGTIMESESMKELIKSGELPELTREEAYSFFDRTTEPLGAMTVYKLGEITSIRANQLGALVAERPDMMNEAREALLFRLKECSGFTVEELMEDEDAIEFFGTYFRVLKLRDAMIMASFGMQDEIQQVSLAVARTLSEEARANALCCYALTTLGTPVSHRLMPALAAAQKEVPGHRLSQLMTAGYTRGGSELLMSVVYRGALIDAVESSSLALGFAARSIHDYLLEGNNGLKNELLPQMLQLIDVNEVDPLPQLHELMDCGREDAA